MLLPVFLLLVTGLMAVKHEDFKRCDQSGFCQRSRGRLEFLVERKQELGWRVNEKSVVFDPTTGKLTLTLQKGDDVVLSGLLQMLEDGRMMRLQVDEQGEQSGKRYRIPEGDAVSADLDAAEEKWVEQRPDEPGHHVYSGPDGLALHLYLDPFKLVLLDGEDVAAEINGLGLFHVETGKTESAALSSDNGELADSEGDSFDYDDNAIPLHFERGKREPNERGERWKGHLDSQPNGPRSLSLDISFPASRHIYGLPEHTTGLDLKTTCKVIPSSNRPGSGMNVTYPDEPYRLYNLDVFEYELESTMALYASIPFVLAGSAESRVGVLWNNPSETWVDVIEADQKTGRSLYLRSESGLLDVFIMAGHRTAASVLTAYAQATGFPALPPLWSLGYHQCRWNYRTQADLLAVHAGFDEHRIPVDVLWLDIEHTDGKRYFTWDEQMFPEPEAMQRDLEHKGRHLITIVDPHIKADAEFEVYKELTEGRMAVLDHHKQIFSGHCWPGISKMDISSNCLC